MLSHTGEKPFICKQCNYLFVYLHIRHPGTSFLRSSYNYIFKNIAYVIVYVWPSRTWDEILLPFQKGLFFPLGDIRLFLPTRIRICAYAHHPTWIRHGRIRMAIPSLNPCQDGLWHLFLGEMSMYKRAFAWFCPKIGATECPFECRGGLIAIWAMPKWTEIFFRWGFPK